MYLVTFKSIVPVLHFLYIKCFHMLNVENPTVMSICVILPWQFQECQCKIFHVDVLFVALFLLICCKQSCLQWFSYVIEWIKNMIVEVNLGRFFVGTIYQEHDRFAVFCFWNRTWWTIVKDHDFLVYKVEADDKIAFTSKKCEEDLWISTFKLAD